MKAIPAIPLLRNRNIIIHAKTRLETKTNEETNIRVPAYVSAPERLEVDRLSPSLSLSLQGFPIAALALGQSEWKTVTRGLFAFFPSLPENELRNTQKGKLLFLYIQLQAAAANSTAQAKFMRLWNFVLHCSILKLPIDRGNGARSNFTPFILLLLFYSSAVKYRWLHLMD